MNKVIHLIFLFISFLLLQVIILNNILLFGFVTPYLYIIFILIFPFYQNRFFILTASFLLGVCMDMFTNYGGINTFSTLFIAYIRPWFFKKIFQKYEKNIDLFDLNNEPFGKKFNYFTILTFIHNFILFSLINFSFNNFFNILLNTFLSSIFTLLLYFLGSFIIKKQ